MLKIITATILTTVLIANTYGPVAGLITVGIIGCYFIGQCVITPKQ